MPDIDHEWTNELVCPHCGYEHSDSWELNDGDEGDWDHECHDCQKTFAAQRFVTVKYGSEVKR